MMAPVFTRASWRCAWHMIQVWPELELLNTRLSVSFLSLWLESMAWN